MGIINVLDKHTANLIAAGEVVERPASAVKEMLENCADAGASAVTVEIKDGGTSFVRITDNGCGMAREDVPKAILRHATSKIKTGSDLEAIGTLGFRGEALAAIAAVSAVRILTKRPEDDIGTLFVCRFGEVISTEDAGYPDGTTIIVENIFENTPARRKFLKKNTTEGTAVYAVCEKFALSRPSVSVRLISDGNIKLQTPGDGKMQNTIYAAVGREFASAMLPVDYEYAGVRVYGYIGKPEICRANRNMQNFFVNGRYIKSRTLMAALEEGFRGFCPIGKFPACVLFVELDLRLVDVNIHPAKLEIKFSDEHKVFDTLYFAVKNALSRGISSVFAAESDCEPFDMPRAGAQNTAQVPQNAVHAEVTQPASNLITDLPKERDALLKREPPCTPPIPETPPVPVTPPVPPAPMEVEHEPPVPAAPPIPPIPPVPPIPSVPEKTPSAASPVPNTPAHKPETVLSPLPPENANPFDRQEKPASDAHDELVYTELKPLFTEPARKIPERQTVYSQDAFVAKHELVKAVYIGEVFDTYLIAERAGSMYLIDKHAAHERIIYERIKHASDTNDAQYLLEPVSVTLTPKEFDAVRDNTPYFTAIGFDFEEFGSDTFLVRSKPTSIENSDIKDVFTFLAGRLAEGNTKSAGEIFDRALYTAACKAAIKAGNKFTETDNRRICEEIFTNDAVLYCPHGRPVLVEYTKERLEKMFGRT